MGKRYLCPVCEHELKGLRKYCPECRSFVKEPLVFTGAFLPNESSCYRNDVDYMDPRKLKKQQAHMYEHKKNLPDRPEYTLDQGHKPAQRAIERGRDWLEQQRRANSDRNQASRTGGYTYGGQMSSIPKQKKKNDSSGIITIVFILLFLLSNC